MTAVGIESPCISVCMIDEEEGYCRGCYRSLDEVANWLSFTHAERRGIMAQLELRRAGEVPQPANTTIIKGE